MVKSKRQRASTMAYIENMEDEMKKNSKRNPHKRSRVVWGFNPVTRVKPLKKRYSRKNYNVNKEEF